ncbi:MAG: cell division protein FtsW [Deltaproteobacteria bacterium RIFOXYA12_FULL_61_11]|nr:MAG: cell division protein FtsW [Deltaproteobacteria bacterium RIFOXYA12_FULL_61_11]
MKKTSSLPFLGHQSIDYVIFFGAILVGVFGSVAVFSSSAVYSELRYQDAYLLFKKQLIFLVLGVGLMTFFAHLRTDLIRHLVYPMLVLGFLLLVFLFIPGLGTKVNAAQRWFRLGFLSIQPAELAKVGLMLYLAHILAKKGDKVRELVHGVFPILSVVLCMMVLLILQPDFGSTVLVGLLALLMLFLAGTRISYLLGLVAVTYPLLHYSIMGVDYRRKRLLSFLDPWADPQNSGFQMIQSFLGFHRGGLFGVGFGDGKQKLLYLPEAHTDFVFTSIGEEFGFLGALTVVLMFLVLIIRAWFGAKSQEDDFRRLAGFGLVLLLAFQTLFNLGVVIGLLPTKGLALPFISYGGSSLVCSYLLVGLLLNVTAVEHGGTKPRT